MKILEKEHCGNHSRVSAKNKEEELPCHVKCNVHKNEDTSVQEVFAKYKSLP